MNLFNKKKKEEPQKEEPKTEIFSKEEEKQELQVGFLGAWEQQQLNINLAILEELRQIKEMLGGKENGNRTEGKE